MSGSSRNPSENLLRLRRKGKSTVIKSTRSNTLASYKRKVFQLNTFITNNGRPSVLGDNGSVVRKPDINDVVAFLESKREGVSDIQKTTLEGYRSAWRKNKGAKFDFNEGDLKVLSDFFKGVANETADGVREGSDCSQYSSRACPCNVLYRRLN